MNFLDYTQDTKNIWFPDQKEPIYDPSNEENLKEFNNYWRREKDRCVNGFTLADGQVKISGWLYSHTVYWKIALYKEGRKGKKYRVIDTPLLRDVDWDVDQDFQQCDEHGKFYNLVGSRDWGKSIIGASRAGWMYTFFDNSECVISGGADNYIKLVTDKIEDGLTNIHPIWKKQRLASDWKKEIMAGWKDKKTNQPDPKSSKSKIIIRNYENGVNSMAANGTRPGFHLIDEEGTIQHLIACVKDSDGCWWSGGGDKPSCLVMLAGTGGDMERGKEAAEMFFKPDAYNMLAFENPEGDGKMGRFVSALRSRMQYKDEKTLAEYLGIDHPDLQRIKILVSNEEKAYNEWWLPQYEKAKKSGNPKTLLKFKAYWPLNPSDSFLVLSSNNYNVEAAKVQRNKILQNEVTGTPVFMVHDGERIKHVFTDKLPISEFPCKTQDTDAPAVIWEFPVENPPFGLYIAGVDPYRQDDSEYSDSLGAVYIYKRMHDITSEKFQDMFVAAYVARPASVDEWCEQARLLIKYYNAFTLCENDDMTFIRYMQNKGDDYYLSDQPQWLKQVVPFSSVNRGKGIHRSSEKVRSFLRTCLKRYLDDVIYREEGPDGSVIKEVYGVTKVLDPMLLEEIIKFNSKDGNYDREVAASLAIALADKMAPMGKANAIATDPRYQALFGDKKQERQTLFLPKKHSLFTGRKRKLFY